MSKLILLSGSLTLFLCCFYAYSEEQEQIEFTTNYEYEEENTRPCCRPFFTFPSHLYRYHYDEINRDQDASWPGKRKSLFYDQFAR